MAIDVLFGGIPVTELEPSIDWYERFLGRPPDMAPNETERTCPDGYRIQLGEVVSSWG